METMATKYYLKEITLSYAQNWDKFCLCEIGCCNGNCICLVSPEVRVGGLAQICDGGGSSSYLKMILTFWENFGLHTKKVCWRIFEISKKAPFISHGGSMEELQPWG